MDLKKLIQEYLKKTRVMQLGTSVNNQPWVCNLHFHSDDELNLYWISTLDRRHSQEIEQNPQVAVAINVHEDTPAENYVIGVSIEGEAVLLDDSEVKKVGSGYVTKLRKSKTLLDDILKGKNPHKFYALKPTKIILFDSKNFPNEPRQEYTV